MALREERGAGQPANPLVGWPAGPAWDGPPVDTGVPYSGDAPPAPPPLDGAFGERPGESERVRERERERETERERKSMNFWNFSFSLFQVIQ